MSDNWCSIDDVADHLAVRRETIYRWIKRRSFPAYRIGTVYKVRIADVDEWVKQDGGEQGVFSEFFEEDAIIPTASIHEPITCSCDNVATNRANDYRKIRETLKKYMQWGDERNLLLQGDSLQILRQMPPHSVSLIVTDPPYHSTQKSNILGDTQFKNDDEYLGWIKDYVSEWKRVLRPNGSLYCFCSGVMSARLEVIISGEFNILSNITWTKPNAPGFDGWKNKMNKGALRQWYGHSEKIIFAEPSEQGNLFRSCFGNMLHSWRVQAKMSMKDLAERIGAYGKINHGGSIANWEAGRNIPSREQYEKIRNALLDTRLITKIPDYCDVIRPFKVSSNAEFTDVWSFPNVRPYKGKHPAEKPIQLLEHIVKASSYEGDIVLDCFSGSGSTAIAALKSNRLSVSIELDEQWVNRSRDVFESISQTKYSKFPNNYSPETFDLSERLL